MKKSVKKANSKNVEIVMLLDRSGSMALIQSDMEGAINTYVKDQQKSNPKAKFTFAQFDTEYELLHDGVDIKSIKHLELHPRGNTALLDAIGKTINVTSQRSKNMVLFVIVTDGQENSSHEFSRSQIFDMIKVQKDNGWDFVFLGANQDAIQAGEGIGISAGKCLTYKASKKGTRAMGQSLCCYTQSFSACGQSANFTQKDRDEQKE